MVDTLSHVAVAVIKNDLQQILISKRHHHVHQGGLWEFPGGKIEPGESVREALSREINEELGISIQSATPLINIKHDYPDKIVLLDVWEVESYTGNVYGKEGQPFEWVSIDKLPGYDFPAANIPIIKALMLPDKWMITSGFSSVPEYIESITFAIDSGVRLIQLRAPHFSDMEYMKLATPVSKLCRRNNVDVMFNTSYALYQNHRLAEHGGLHLTSKRMMDIYKPELSDIPMLSTSIHNKNELEHACDMNVDFGVISPVQATICHPDTKPMGFSKFHELANMATFPVYALGGMKYTDIEKVKKYGGQGIAAISEFIK